MHRPTRVTNGCAAAIVAALASATAAAQSAPPPTRVETLFVTATTRDQQVQDVQASVQVITAKDLEAYQGTSVTEALKLAVGVDARANGANSSVAIRGFIAGAGTTVLVLVDGLRRTSKYGTTNLNLIALEDVERIEIVRGPMSALYGADATGGVINVITKSPGSTPGLGGTARATLGRTTDDQRDTVIAGATARFGGDGHGHRMSVETRQRDLFRYDKSAVTADLGEIDEVFASYEGRWDPAPGHRLRGVLEYTDQMDTSPGLLAAAPPVRPTPVPFEGYEQEKRKFGSLRYEAKLGPGELDLEAALGESDGATTRSYPTVETTDYRQRQLLARYTIVWSEHAIVAGIGSTRDDVDVSINSTKAARTNNYALAQDEWTIAPDWKLLAGVRRDTFTDFDSVTTPRVSVRHTLGPWGLRAGYGTAYRAPSVLEQYSRFTRGRFVVLGNPDLRPEENKTWEAAAAYNGGGLSGEAVYFSSKVSDLIQTVSSPARPGDPAGVTTRSVYTNVASADIRGVELSGAWQFSRQWSMQASYEWLDATDGDTGARLTQRSRQAIRGGLRFEQGAWRADLLGRYYKDFYNTDPNIRVGPNPAFNTSYGTLDAKVSWRTTRAVELFVGMDNITDRRQPVNWSNTGSIMDPPARYAYGGVRVAF